MKYFGQGREGLQLIQQEVYLFSFLIFDYYYFLFFLPTVMSPLPPLCAFCFSGALEMAMLSVTIDP